MECVASNETATLTLELERLAYWIAGEFIQACDEIIAEALLTDGSIRSYVAPAEPAKAKARAACA